MAQAVVDVAVELCLLGDIEVRRDGRLVDLGPARQRCVLVALLVEPNRVVPAELLVDRVWADRPPQRARGALYSYLSRLRTALDGPDGVGIVRRPGGYLLSVDPMAVDLHRFRRLVTQARAAGDDPAAALYEQALGLWRGDAFATLDTPWLNAVRESLHRERLAAELDRNDLALGRGQHAAVLAELLAAAAAHPLDERLAGQFMLALYRDGRQADALSLFQEIRRRLADELGADPNPALGQLHQRILTADPALVVPARTAGASVLRPDPASTPRSGSAPVPRQLPASPNSFTGRAVELAELSKVMHAGPDRAAAVVISAIGGSGGIGKTWLALRWAHDNVDRFPDGQLYVDLRGFDPSGGPVDPAMAVRGFLEALGVEPGRMPVDPDAQAGLYRSLVASRRMLIVLDNARDTSAVAPLLPGTATSAVLVTSRRQLAGLISAHGARPLTLDVLPDSEARQLLVHTLGAERVAAEAEPVTVLLRHCAGLPLALGIVAARAAIDPDLSLGALAAELREASLDALDAGELAVNLRAVVSCSHDALSPDAARAFRLLGLAPGPDLSLPAAASLTGLPADRTRALLRELTNAHLVREQLPGRYRMHDLVRLYATEQAHRLDTADERRAAVHRVLDHYLHHAYAADRLLHPHRDPITLTPPQTGVGSEHLDDPRQALDWFTAEHPVLLAAIDESMRASFDTHTWQLAWTLTTFFDRKGRWSDQITIQGTALRAARRHPDRQGQARAHHGLARTYIRLNRHDEARTHLRHALDLFGQLDDLAGQARIHFDTAWHLERQGRFQDALVHDHHALGLFETAGNPSGQANTLNVIGWHHAQLGDHQRALTHCERALTVLQALGERRGQAGTWDSIGYAHHHLGHHDEAAACYRQSLDLLRELGDKSQEAVVLVHLGDNDHAAGAGESARTAWQEALAILDELGHPDADQVRDKLHHLDQPEGDAPI